MRTLQCTFIVAALLLPIGAHAAYQNPIITDKTVLSSGFTQLTFQFTGNAGEPVVRIPFIVQPSTTVLIVRNWVDKTLVELDAMTAVLNVPSAQVGQTVTRLAAVPPVPTARQAWRRKVEWYTRLAGQGFTGAIATDLAALKTDIETTYQAGFLIGE